MAEARQTGPLPEASERFGEAFARTRGDMLVVGTGLVERHWRWTGKGFATVGLRNVKSGKDWAVTKPAALCDWSLGETIGETANGSLVSLAAKAVENDPWTSPHLEAVAEIDYPSAHVRLQYVIWAYPGAPGIRTQLRLKSTASRAETPKAPAAANGPVGRAECVPVAFGETTRRLAIGYYNDTQHRNTRETPILREESVSAPQTAAETFDWSSLLCLEAGDEGLCLVKESHKCVNQPGVKTGAFVCDDAGVSVTGLGLGPEDLLTERFRECWATWCVVYSGGADSRELALKRFDRRRYPIDPARDVYILANTWGSSPSGDEAKKAACEENVLREIASQADLGIDVQQIDDGWQGNGYGAWRPTPDHGRYPAGWAKVRAEAERQGVALGLWAAWGIGRDDLVWNHDHGGFRYYKLDFAKLNTYDKLEGLMRKVRALIEHSGHRVRVNWDVTENPPRVGYYFGREYGNIYLENRKPERPEHVVYTPYLVLRDAWHVAKYVNLNKFQVTVQNIDRVNPQASDAHAHNHPYCVAITLMGSPIFFQQTQFYTEAARRQIRPLLAAYKRHRREMFEGYVLPIGDEPDNSGWTGFQCHLPGKDVGYLTLFREIENLETERVLRLRFLAGRTLEIENLTAGDTQTLSLDAAGRGRFRIDKPSDFRFLRYKAR